MKKKIITLLVISSLAMAMTGCKVEAKNSTGDKELDSQIAEINDYVQDAYEEEAAYEKEREESLAKSKSDSLSINNDSLDFGDIYLVNKNGLNAMVFGIKHSAVFPDDTIISFYGINDGEEKLLDEYQMDFLERSGFGVSYIVDNSGGLDILVPAIRNFNGVIETIQTCFIDWDGYDSYRIDIRMEDGDIFEPKVLDTASYEIDSEDLIMVTEDEFVQLRAKEVIDSIDSNQFESNGLLINYNGDDITSAGEGNLNISIENTSSLPVGKYKCELEIMDSYGNKSGTMRIDDYIQINPGEVKEFSVGLYANKLNIETGKEYVVRVYIYNTANSEVVVDGYVKSTFR